jgi:hypothetical protein
MLEAQLAQSGLSDAEKAAIRAQAQTEGMSAGLGLTAATVAAQQARHEVDNAWLAQADKSENQRLEDYQKSPEYQAREIERLAILNWIKTGENPPPSMLDKTEDERLAMYKDTYTYQSQQASLAAWQAEQEKKVKEEPVKQPDNPALSLLDLKFDPFIGYFADELFDSTFVESDLYRFDDVWNAAKDAYDFNNIDLMDLALNGQKNPLTIDDIYQQLAIPVAVETALVDRSRYKPYTWFLEDLDEILGTKLSDNGSYMQFEANYLDALMKTYPDVLEKTKDDYEYEFPTSDLDDFQKDIWEEILQKAAERYKGGGTR